MTDQDPWADPEDPFSVPASGNTEDPFASEDVYGGGGEFTPRPSISDIAGRLIVLVPREYDEAAETSEFARKNFGAKDTEERWTVDIVVLDGGTLSFDYTSKVQGTEDQYEEKRAEVTDLPYLIPGMFIRQGNLKAACRKLEKAHTFGLGRIRPGYAAAQMRKRATMAEAFQDWQNEMDAWEVKARQNPRGAGDPPRSVWHFEPTANGDDKALAMAWWAKAKADGFKITN